MPSKTETAARRLVAEIYRATHDGRPQRWCNLSEVCERTGADSDAVQLAALKPERSSAIDEVARRAVV
jgi:hypothetical protein